MLLVILLTAIVCQVHGLTVEGASRVNLNGLSFDLNLYADTRIAEFTYQPLDFSVSSAKSSGIYTLTYTSAEMDVVVSISPRQQYSSSAWLFSINANCKQDLYLHDVYLSMDEVGTPFSATLKGVEAIMAGDPGKNLNIISFRDKAVEYSGQAGKFWIVASNYAECEGVEVLSANRIVLYDYKGHFFRKYVQGGTWEQLRDTMYKPEGGTHKWAFLLFTEQPILLSINRWPADKKAALCITNDADSESLNRLKAVFEGSNNPDNPKYYTQGFFARKIPVSNTVFGFNQSILGDMWTSIKEQGNSIGYHTYSGTADPVGTNQQALLSDLVPYDIRLWIDHAVPQNPEDICYNGLDPQSVNYVADVINQSGIDYIWPGDTPYTNPFDAYEETWRLPHIVYEAKDFTRPIWFFGRTREEFWEYPNYLEQLSMKYLMTSDNLDKLIGNRGLHICYTHLSAGNNTYCNGFFQIADNGDYEIRDDVDDMLLMLDYYRAHRGLWIDTVENIFDRMLAIEQIRIVSCQTVDEGVYQITLENGSDYELKDLSFKFRDLSINVPLFTAENTLNFFIADNPGVSSVVQKNFLINYQKGSLVFKNRYNLSLAPVKIEIFNLRGQKVQTYESTVYQDQFICPFTNKASGIYFARISPESGTPSLIRFTVLK
jgi:hypothetical protein